MFTDLVLCDFLATCFPIFKVVARNLCGVACGVGAVAGQTALGSATSQAAPGGAQQLSGGDAPCMGACWPHMRKSPPSRRSSTSNQLLTAWQVSQWGFVTGTTGLLVTTENGGMEGVEPGDCLRCF